MCFGGGGKVNTGPQMQIYSWTDSDGNGQAAYAEAGIPEDYVEKDARTVTQYQEMAQQDLSDKQIAAQQADQNAIQYGHQADLQAQQQGQGEDQAARQTVYDTGRAQAAQGAQKQIDTAFSQFSPDYFNQYVKDYMAKATDPITYQQTEAQKQLQFALARQGISSSQAGVNQQGLIQETAGRATDQAASDAQDAVNTLKSNVANARQN